MVILSSFFFVGGALFGYFVVFPFAFKYFMSFASEYIRPLPSMKEYFSLASFMLLTFWVIFELPVVLTLLARIGIISAAFLRKNRKYSILLIFIISAILTPTPDMVNQFLMAGPLMILYEVSIWGARVFGKRGGDSGGKGRGIGTFTCCDGYGLHLRLHHAIPEIAHQRTWHKAGEFCRL